MRRVASLYLPEWPLDRLRRAGRLPRRTTARPSGPGRQADDPYKGAVDALDRIAAAERAKTCSVAATPEGRPGAAWAREGDRDAMLSRRHQGSDLGWRPGARWARADLEAEVSRLPSHQRPSMRELGRRSEAAPRPFRTGPADDAEAGRHRSEHGAVPPVRGRGEGVRDGPYPGEGAFFLTGRMSGEIVGRACAEGGLDPSGMRPIAGSPAEPPVVTFHRVDGRDLVHSACPIARASGVERGTWLSQARACIPGLVILPADPVGDRAALDDLAAALARRWAPTVAISGEDGLFVHLTGVAHLHGGEHEFCERLGHLLSRLGYRNRFAVADTPGAAWALARRPGLAPITICPPGGHIEALTSFPVEALRLDLEHIHLLGRLGVDTVGELARLPRAPLARRFGGALIRRFDQATGRIPEPLEPVAVPERIAVAERFFEPIGCTEAMERCLGRLAAELAVALARAGQGARSMLLVVERVDGRAQTLRISLARPNRQAEHLLRLLSRSVGEIDPGFGIDALSIRVLRADPLNAEALGPELAERQVPDLGTLVDLLANRPNGCTPWRVTAVESDVPERSVAFAPPLEKPRRDGSALREDDVRRLHVVEDDHPWHPRWPRPIRLLPRPEPVEHVMAELPDNPPKRFTWRGESYRVVRADGPERITGEWWRRSAEREAVRDYFSVEDESGRRFWLFRRGDGWRPETGDLSWHLHGLFG